jgi:hypothetical protein
LLYELHIGATGFVQRSHHHEQASLSNRANLFELVGRLFPLLLICAVSACASNQRQKTLKQPLVYRGGALAITPGISFSGPTPTLAGFRPDLSYAPLWFDSGKTIGLAGDLGEKSAVLGVASDGSERTVAEDRGPGAPTGRLLDIAVSIDANAIATLASISNTQSMQVFVSESGSAAPLSPVAEIPGNHTQGLIRWINGQTLAVVLERDVPGNADEPARQTDFYIVKLTPRPEARQLDQVRCAGKAIAFSPDGKLALSQAEPGAPLSLIDLQREDCRALNVSGPIQFLQWAPDSASFLFVANDPSSTPDVFRYLLETDTVANVAISSRSAAFASDGTIIAIGSSGLSARRAAEQPDHPLPAQVALMGAEPSALTINQLGFEIAPANLARSTFVYSTASDEGLLDATFQGPDGPVRELIEYSYRMRAAFVLARVQLDASLVMSWSPDGRRLAILERPDNRAALTVIRPPR